MPLRPDPTSMDTLTGEGIVRMGLAAIWGMFSDAQGLSHVCFGAAPSGIREQGSHENWSVTHTGMQGSKKTTSHLLDAS